MPAIASWGLSLPPFYEPFARMALGKSPVRLAQPASQTAPRLYLVTPNVTGEVRGRAMPKANATTELEPEHLTEELLERLLSSTSIESYLDGPGVVDRTLVSYLSQLLASHGLTRAQVARASGINATVVYDVFSGKSRPGRDHAIMLALGLGCDLRETQRLLRLAGVSELWCKVRRDAILIWCVEHGLSRVQADDELWRFGERTLLGTGPLRAR